MTPRAQATDPNGQGDLISGVGSEIEVGLKRWSAGQIGLTELIVAGAVVAGAAGIAWLVRRLLARMGSRVGGPAVIAAGLAGQAASVAIYLFATGIVLEVLGFSVGPLIAILLMLVLAVLFLRPLVANLSAGLLLQLRGPFRPGDLVETTHVLGVVEEVNARTVVIVTPDGRTAYVPNGRVLDEVLVNHSSIGRRRSELSLRLGPGVDVGEVAERLQTAVSGVGGVLDDPPPDVLVRELDGSLTCLDVRFWHRPPVPAERVARDQVARAILDVVDSSELDLADPAIAVRSTGAADLDPGAS